MANVRSLINAIRYRTNTLLNIDFVRASGQHTLRTHMVSVLRKYMIEKVIDVGASEGGFGTQLRSLGFHGDIYSFEPVKDAYDRLTETASADSKWTTFNFALGAERNISTINVSRFTQFSSLLPASKYGTDRWVNLEIAKRQTIEVRTLDDVVAEGLIPSTARYLLKMDTQGYDLEVFKGSSIIRPQICCMLSELSLIPIYEGMPHYIESLSVYEKAGFMVSGFYPITRNADLALNEVDCMMVRPEQMVAK